MDLLLKYLNTNDILAFAVIVAPVTSALTEIIKRNFNVPKDWIPLMNIVIGILCGLFYPAKFDIVIRILGGAFAGLAGIGGFEAFFKRPLPFVTKIKEAFKKDKAQVNAEEAKGGTLKIGK